MGKTFHYEDGEKADHKKLKEQRNLRRKRQIGSDPRKKEKTGKKSLDSREDDDYNY